MSEEYNTEQRESVIEFFAEHPDEYFSARDIIAAPSLRAGEATVYRLLNRLTDGGVLVKYAGEGGRGSVYRYAGSPECAGHIHLQCVHCGKLTHLDCRFIDDFTEHIKADHEFTVDSSKTVIYGVCRRCRAQGL